MRVALRRILPFAMVLAAIVASGTHASAQSTTAPAGRAMAPAPHDPRWQPWLGCWRPVGSAAPSMSDPSELATATTPTMICVVPGATPTAVSVVNFSGGSVTDRSTIETGASTPRSVGGCTGTETATWSRDGNRVLLRATFACGRGVTREESGVLSMSDDGEWVQAQSVTINGQTNTYVARFQDTGIALEAVANGAIVERPLLDAAGKRISPPRTGCTGSDKVVPSDDGQQVTVSSDYLCANNLHRVASAVFRRTADGGWARVDAAPVPFGSASVRAAAGAPVSTDDVLEVAQRVNVAVAEAWLADRGQGFALNAKELVRLADRGLPPRMIDMLVAVSHPESFMVRPAERRGAADIAMREPPRPSAADRRGCGSVEEYCRPVVGLNWLYGADRYYGWGSYGYGMPIGGIYGAYGYMPYGYSPYGVYGYGSPYGAYLGPGYYAGYGPVVITTRQPVGEEGRAVYGQGYTRRSPSGGSSSSTAGRPSSAPASTGSGASSGGASSSGSTSSGGGSSSARTAKPRGGG